MVRGNSKFKLWTDSSIGCASMGANIRFSSVWLQEKIGKREIKREIFCGPHAFFISIQNRREIREEISTFQFCPPQSTLFHGNLFLSLPFYFSMLSSFHIRFCSSLFCLSLLVAKPKPSEFGCHNMGH